MSPGPGPEKDVDSLDTFYDQLEVGQRMKYVFFLARNYRSGQDSVFEYQPDTLFVDVLFASENGWLLQESYAPGSRAPGIIREAGYDTTHHASYDSTARYFVRMANDSLIFLGENGSRVSSIMFGQLHNFQRKLPLRELDDEAAEVVGWRSGFEYCECYMQGYADNVDILGRHYTRLNIVMEDQYMVGDGPGTTWMYSRDTGIVRLYWVNWWTQRAEGWDLIPE